MTPLGKGALDELTLSPLRGQGIDPESFSRETFTQFQTWLGETKSSEGCPVNCTYCFFKLDGQTPKRPDIRLTPAETVAAITAAPTYHASMPVHFGSQTDAFSTPPNVAHYTEILRRYGDSGLPNPVVFITKRTIPDDVIALARDLEQPVLFFVSYSGLGGTGLEPTVKSAHLRDNLVRLHEAGTPGIHYWRPFVPQNSAPELMAEMLDFVSRYALCSTVNGLKLNSGIRDFVAPFWPELRDRDDDFDTTGEFWPEGVRAHLVQMAAELRGYPLFFDTSCAVSHALGVPDLQGALDSRLCLESACPQEQRTLCRSQAPRPESTDVAAAAQAAGIPMRDVAFDGRRVRVRGRTPTARLVELRTRLRLPVDSDTVDYAGHNWASAVDAEDMIVEVPWSPVRA